MTELKTLKDLKDWPMSEEDVYAFSRGKFFDTFILKKQLKQEAIKWVKSKQFNQREPLDSQDWIKFFNLTEEDLK